jgi:hypothetical protein
LNLPAGVEAELHYVRNPPRRGEPMLTHVTDDETRSTMVNQPGQSVWIENVRGHATSLDREGFILARHRTTVANFENIEKDIETDRIYIAEMMALLAAHAGAARMFVLRGAKLRYAEGAVDKLAAMPSSARPARYVHGDVTDISGPQQAQMLIGEDTDLGAYSRWALYNLWRSVSPPPQDAPLTLCDVRSVAPEDEVPVLAITTSSRGGALQAETASYTYNPAHRWCYFSNMTPDEVVIFKTHDTDPARAHRVPHTAFTDSTCPPDAPPRASVEMRLLALFD